MTKKKMGGSPATNENTDEAQKLRKQAEQMERILNGDYVKTYHRCSQRKGFVFPLLRWEEAKSAIHPGLVLRSRKNSWCVKEAKKEAARAKAKAKTQAKARALGTEKKG